MNLQLPELLEPWQQLKIMQLGLITLGLSHGRQGYLPQDPYSCYLAYREAHKQGFQERLNNWTPQPSISQNHV